MFKTVLTLFRGSVAAAGEELEDRTALLILDQQMRDAAAAVERSKRMLALAIAGDQQEGRRLDATNARIADLEVRATAALDAGSPISKSAPPQHSMAAGKISPARRHSRSPTSRPTATP